MTQTLRFLHYVDLALVNNVSGLTAPFRVARTPLDGDKLLVRVFAGDCPHRANWLRG